MSAARGVVGGSTPFGLARVVTIMRSVAAMDAPRLISRRIERFGTVIDRGQAICRGEDYVTLPMKSASSVTLVTGCALYMIMHGR